MEPLDIGPFALSLFLDILSVFIVAYLLYFRRHRNRTMMVAIAMINLSLFALAGALTAFTLSIGAGFALFAVISIIRLRSETAGWIEMAYLLGSLSIGLVLGLPGFDYVQELIYAGILVIAMFILDHPRISAGKSQQKVSLTLDGTDLSGDLKARVEAILGRAVAEVTVKSVTMVPPATKVDVKFLD